MGRIDLGQSSLLNLSVYRTLREGTRAGVLVLLVYLDSTLLSGYV